MNNAVLISDSRFLQRLWLVTATGCTGSHPERNFSLKPIIYTLLPFCTEWNNSPQPDVWNLQLRVLGTPGLEQMAKNHSPHCRAWTSIYLLEFLNINTKPINPFQADFSLTRVFPPRKHSVCKALLQEGHTVYTVQLTHRIRWWFKTSLTKLETQRLKLMHHPIRSLLPKASVLSKPDLAVTSPIQHHFYCLAHSPHNLCRSISKSAQDSGLCKLHLPPLSQKLKELKEHPQPLPSVTGLTRETAPSHIWQRRLQSVRGKCQGRT